jgi:hypothetical protein
MVHINIFQIIENKKLEITLHKFANKNNKIKKYFIIIVPNMGHRLT